MMTNLILRKAGSDDLAVLTSWLTDLEICRHLTDNLRGATMTEMLLASGLRRRDQAWYLFSETQGGVPLGLVALDNIEPGDAHANLWFLLGAKERQGQGLTSAAIATFCEANPEDLHSVEAWAVSDNVASIRCMERAGFIKVGLMPEAVNLERNWRDRVVFQRLMRQAGIVS